MRYVVCALFAIGVGIALAATPVLAHHAIAAKFDPGKPMTLRGTVIGIDWHNPHAHIFIDVSAGANSTMWAVELDDVVALQKNGWTRETLKPGDQLAVEGIVARDGTNQIWGNSVVVSTTGRRVFTVSNQPPASSGKPVPRSPDGKPRLGPVSGEAGYWGYPSATVLFEAAANVQMDEFGLLRNIADVDKVAPFQAWARDLYEYRQRTSLKDDPMFLFCKPPGGLRQWQLPHGNQFVEDHDRQRIFLLTGTGNQNFRIIYTDGRPQQGQLRGDADNPLYYGRSVAHWEGDTLVVDTKGFNEKFWFTNGGLPHTEQLHLIERFTRVDHDTLRYEVSIDDPGAYTRPWSSGWTFRWVAGEDLPKYFCQDNRQ